MKVSNKTLFSSDGRLFQCFQMKALLVHIICKKCRPKLWNAAACYFVIVIVHICKSRGSLTRVQKSEDRSNKRPKFRRLRNQSWKLRRPNSQDRGEDNDSCLDGSYQMYKTAPFAATLWLQKKKLLATPHRKQMHEDARWHMLLPVVNTTTPAPSTIVTSGIIPKQ